MELDAEGGTSIKQLQELIKKECNKRDKKYQSLEQKYNKLQESVEHSQQQKKPYEGPTRRLKQKEIATVKSTKGGHPTRSLHFATTPSTTYQSKRKSRRYKQRRHKRQLGKAKKEQAFTIATEEKAYQLRSEQVTTTIENKLKQQFGFVADPKKTLLHIASSAVANTPTCYSFSRPSHLAVHDFTQQKQPPKTLRSLLGLGLKFVLTPHPTNIRKNLEKTTMPKFQCAIHLRFHFPGTTNSSDEPYDPKMYVQSNWTPPHWTKPPVVLDKCLKKFSITLDKLFEKQIGKPNLQQLQLQQDFLICPCDKNLGPAIIERHNCINIAMRDHLLDGRTYQPLSNADCAKKPPHAQGPQNKTRSKRDTPQKPSNRCLSGEPNPSVRHLDRPEITNTRQRTSAIFLE